MFVFALFLLGVHGWYMPPVRTTWQWQLDGKIDTSFPENVYDIDLFNTSTETIDELHSQGKKVICYYSAGTYEPDRPDSNNFPNSVKGNRVDGWPEEKWLDIRQIDVLGPIMSNRTLLAKQKNCDGIEADNVDGYSNPTGFPLTYKDQINYNTFIANMTHTFDLSIGLKNDVDKLKI